MSTSEPTSTQQGTNVSSSVPSPPTSESQSNSDTAALYLFTFLATILILVLLSASLVLRSYILRRRYRQHFRQALITGLFADIDHSPFNGAGQFDALPTSRRSARRPGPKPVLWDTWTPHHPDKDSTSWTSIAPVAVNCVPSLSPSTLISLSQPITGPSSPQPDIRPRPFIFSQLRLPSPLSLAATPSRSSQSHSRSPLKSTPGSPGTSMQTEKEAATLSVCVLIAMPDESAPVYHPATDTKGKGVDPLSLGSDGTNQRRNPRARISTRTSDEGLPVLEFGAVEVAVGEWAWSISET